MAKARLYFDGDNTYIEKQARIYKMVDEIGDKIDNIPGVVNNLSSTSETDALSAAMGKELQDQINAMSGNFHFLSSWDCTTGLPGSDPAVDPYVYQSGDYYIVSNTGSTNYKPHGSSYTHGVASTAVETQAVQMNDWYVYDGSTWILQPSGGAQIVIDTALSTTSTNPVENRVITQALNNKQNTIANLSAIESGAAAGATALQPGDNITQLTNNAGYQTAGDVAAAIVGKQDVLTEGDGIDITNNVISCTVEYTGGTDIEVTSNNVINFTNASGYMLKSSNKLIYATTDTAFGTRDKICTTADGNYSPTQGDVLALVFNNGCGVGSPRLNIDNSGLHSIVISSTGGANASTLWLGMSKIAWTFVYDGTNRVTWPIKDTTYSAGTGLSLSSGTFTNTQPGPTIGTTAPSSPTEGAMRYDTTNHVLKVYDGSQWVEVGSGGGGGSTTWGNIGGVLSNQTDLQDALDEKLEATDLIAGTGINITQGGNIVVPSGYTQIEYIESHGTEYLDLGVGSCIGQFELDGQLTELGSTSVTMIGARDAGQYYKVVLARSSSDNCFYTLCGSAGQNLNGASDNTMRHMFIVTNTNNGQTIKVDYSEANRSYTVTSTETNNLYLFARNNQGTVSNAASMRAYSLKITNANGQVVRNMFPAKRDSDNVLGMYDIINDVFYVNQGTGTFTGGPEIAAAGVAISLDDSVWTNDNVEAGTGIAISTGTSARLPSGYTEVEWIQSDGACAIDSGVGFQTVDRVEVVGNFVQNQGGFKTVVGCDNQSASSGGKYGVMLGEGNGGAYYAEGTTTNGTDYVYSSTTPDTNEHTFQTYYSNGNLYISVDGTTDYVTGLRSTGVTTTLGIFARHLQATNAFSTNSTMFKMKTVKMWNGSVLMFDGVPCVRDSDDEPGLYDLVSSTFLANVNSGTFITGPEVVFDPTNVISSTVLGFNNLTYDSMTMGTWSSSILSNLTFPSTAKMAFLNWRARDNTNTDLVYACGQVLIIRGLTLVSSFVGGGDGTNYIYGGVGLDSTNSYINYTQGGRTSNAVMDYTIYFYK